MRNANRRGCELWDEIHWRCRRCGSAIEAIPRVAPCPAAHLQHWVQSELSMKTRQTERIGSRGWVRETKVCLLRRLVRVLELAGSSGERHRTMQARILAQLNLMLSKLITWHSCGFDASYYVYDYFAHILWSTYPKAVSNILAKHTVKQLSLTCWCWNEPWFDSE